MSRFSFEILCADAGSRARRGRLTTPHGVVETPVFMPVGTRAAVKGILPPQLRECGTSILLANTYHLTLRPGADVVEALGGLHRFMNWDGPLLTDSGGYQVFSLAELRTVDDNGVTFKSHVDGAVLHLDAASAVRIQQQLGADIIMALDQCAALPAPREQLERAVERTILWARICRDVHCGEDQALFGIIQGGLELDLRRQCLDALRPLDFPGYALGGLAVGESPSQMADFLDAFAWQLPEDRPRYLMGVGRPVDILRAVAAGMDMFDCVLPTRNGRNSYAFCEDGVRRLRNTRYRTDGRPLDEACDCACCRSYSRAYLRHLFLAGEMLGPILVSLHNIAYYQRLMRRIREAIGAGALSALLARAEQAAEPIDPEDPRC